MINTNKNVGNSIARLSVDRFQRNLVVPSHHVSDMSGMMRLHWTNIGSFHFWISLSLRPKT